MVLVVVDLSVVCLVGIVVEFFGVLVLVLVFVVVVVVQVVVVVFEVVVGVEIEFFQIDL